MADNTVESDTDGSDVLRLKACPRCEYSLVGLPARHLCPECGFAYDESMFLLHGWIVGNSLLLDRRRHRVFLVRAGLGTVVWLVCGIIIRTVFSGAPALLVAGVVGVVVLAILLYVLIVRRQAAAGGNASLFFSSSGVVPFATTFPPQVIPWAKLLMLRLQPTFRGRWRLRLNGDAWNSFVLGRFVDVTLVLSRAQADRLRAEIDRRSKEARGVRG